MAEINGEEKRITVSGEQIEEAVGKVPTIEADVKSNKQNISSLQADVSKHTTDIAKNTADIALKANAEEVYSKDETDSAITAKVAEIVAGAPEEFDTLKEMSDWLTEHSGSAAEMNTAIQANAKAIADNAKAIEDNTAETASNKSDILSAEKSIIINQSTIGFQSKNILPNVQPSKAHEGITYTVNADKSITCNGTTGSTASYFSLNSIFTELPDNVDVVFSGCPAGGTVDRYALQLYEEVSPNNKIHWNDYGGGVTGKLPKINNGKYKAMIVIRPNQTVENLTFYPMLRYAGTDDTYVPYIPTVLDRINALVAEIAELKANQAQTTTE